MTKARQDPADDAPRAARVLPLSGVRVVDLSRILAGPWATQILGDLGAEVIKIERPGAGDDTRSWGPPFAPDASGRSAGQDDGPAGVGDAAYFLCANRNKRSVAIDIADPRGADVVRRMAQTAHVFVENFKVGGLARYGLDYDSLSALNPALVYCSVTGFGQTGPERGRAGYDYMIQAMGGLMSITGQPDGAPGAEPMKVGVAVADLFSGMYAAAGMLAALRHAERTGEGQHVDVGLFDCQAAMLANQAANYFSTGVPPTRLGNAHPNIAPYQVFPTLDGHFVVAVGNDRQFAALCRILNREDLPRDERFAANRSRVAHREALAEILRPLFLARPTAAWLAALEEAGVPAGPIHALDAVFHEPQAVDRGFAVDVVRGAGRVRIGAHPVKYSRTAPDTPSAPPFLGADTRAVLSDYLDRDALEKLIAAGVIA